MADHTQLVERFRNLVKWAARRTKLALLLAALLFVLTAEGPPPAKLDTQVNRMLAGERFDFVKWEAQALLGKLTYSLIAPQRYMDESARHDFFLAYLAQVSTIQNLEREIHRIYTDPQVQAPDVASAELRTALAKLRADEEMRQPLAEAILEEQTACVLTSEGFGLLGQQVPPVSEHFTPLPLLLVVSPRDHIENILSLELRHGLDVPRQEKIEEQIDTGSGVSSLVTGIGGLSAYPAMLLESGSINWVAEVAAHEWTHHYLAPHPLGWNYVLPETRVLNETVASIVGKEAGRKMIARYYPEFLPPEPGPEGNAAPSERPAFDFRAEMRQTRIQVDELLAQGKIEAAESYMEERRQEFVAQGYYIRKLNQAYFAFHGAYADQPGASGADPIGPAVREMRTHSPNLHIFAARMSGVTTLAELEALLERVEK